MKTKLTALGVLALITTVLSPAIAQADETHTHAHNGPVVTLISTGQIDDPLEDVLEHPAILGNTSVRD